jgi:hypothetical protein
MPTILRVIFLFVTGPVFLLAAGCAPIGHRGGEPIIHPTYEALLTIPPSTQPVDIPAMVKRHPELKRKVMTAAEYIDEYLQHKKWGESRGKKIIPDVDHEGAEVFVYGAVMKRDQPRVPYRKGLTLLGAIGFVGLARNAEWHQVRVIRRDPNDPKRKSRVIICDLWHNFALGDVRQDIPLFPGDLIVIPERLPDGRTP